MKKRTGKRFAVAAIVAAAVSMAWGCGNKEADTESETETSVAESETAEDGSETAAEEEEIVRPENLGEIKLGEYKGIEVETEEPYIVTDEEVDSYIKTYILPQNKQSVDDEIMEGDTANIDYVGTIDGVEFDGGSDEGFDLEIGSGRFIDGFEDGLIGYKKGDKVDVNVTFPESYGNADLAGKPAVFAVTINDVKRTPELTDALVPQLDPECRTVEEYRSKLKEQFQDNADYSARQSLSYAAIEKIVENSEITPSDEAVEWKVKDLIKNYFEPVIMQTYGLSLDDILEMQGKTRADYEAELESVAEDTVKQIMVAQEVARVQNMVVTDADLEKYAEDNHVSLDELIDAFGRETAEETVLEQKAIDFVVDNAVVKYVSADELSDTSEGEVSDDDLAESEAEADRISEESSQAETEE